MENEGLFHHDILTGSTCEKTVASFWSIEAITEATVVKERL